MLTRLPMSSLQTGVVVLLVPIAFITTSYALTPQLCSGCTLWRGVRRP